MKTKKEKLLKETYDKFIQISLSDFPMKGVEEFIDQKVMGYGTTVDEKVLTIDGFRELVNRQREQGKDIKMTFETAPVILRMGSDGNSALFVDEFVISIHLENNPIKLFLRLSTILEYRDKKWIVIHWHGSKPEYEEGETDTWHINEWKQKTEELERLVDEKTSDLIVKNRELEIETSLEKVRTVAMGMQKTDELINLAIILYKEIITLGFTDVRNAMINIFNDEKETFLNYDYSYDSVSCVNEVGYNSHPTNKIFVEKMQKVDKAFMMTEFTGNDLDEWKKWRISEGEIADSKLDQAKSLYYYEYSIAKGAIGISTFKPITEEQLDVLQKFRNVFDLSYQHFSDLKKAEAQAREAQIEAALERVRARTMGMQNSEELPEVANLLFLQIQSLGIPTWSAGYNSLSTNKRTAECWMSSEGAIQDPFTLVFKDEASFIEQYNFFQSDENFLVQELRGKALEKHYDYMKSIPKVGEIIRELEKSGISLPSYQINHLCKFEQGYLLFISYEPVPEAHEIFIRFTKVFEQTYTRFLDLKKAEAQAREAQIELALERVRARSMAMNSSDELKDVIQIIFNQLTRLSINAEHAGIVVDYKTKGNWNFWIAETQDIPSQVTVPYLDSLWDRQFTEAKKKGKDFFATQLNFEEKNSFYEELLKHIPGLTKKARNFYFSCSGLAISTVIQEDIGLYIENFSGTPYSDEDNTTLKRFGQVFQQTYTRFLDLQKAEAQAREAQIEVALERVRAKSMAMHKSTELADLSLELVKQVQTLGVATWFCAFNIYDDDPQGSLEWGSNGQGTFPKYRTPREGVFLRYYEAGQSGESLLINEIGENECPGHYDYLCSLPGVGEQLLKMKDAGIPFPTSQIDHAAFLKYGYILFITFEPAPEAHDIFRRFAKVFEQTYTRFLDLQKAEAQAREAQIEAALEKIRSRSLAMQKATELGDVVATIVEKLKDLDVVLDANGVVLCTYFNDSKDVLHWIVSEDFSFAGSYLLPYFDHPIFNSTWLSKESGEEYFSKAYSVEVKNSFFEYAFEHSDYKHFPDDFKKWVFQNDQHILSFAWQKNSAILIPSHTGVIPSEEDVAILKRFARVFEQSYTRFLDLQKAEAQAREAQIEAALERARTQSMLMQHSDELNRTSQVFHEQLQILGVDSEFSYLWLPDEKKAEHLFWATWQDDQKHSTSFRNRQVTYPLNKTEPSIAACFVAWESGNVVHINYVAPTEVEDYFATWTELLHGIEKFNPELFAEGLYYVDAYMKYGCFGIVTRKLLSESEQQILSRFTKEFERAYTRFLGLQKAEAQAREVQIELSLERIRAQAMAMKESSDLLDIVVTMRTEFVALGHEAHYFWHMRWQPKVYEKAMTSGDGTRVGMVMDLPRGFHGNSAMIEWEKNNEPVAVFPYDADGAIDYVDKMIKTGDFHKIDHNAPGPDDIRAIGGLTFIMARTTHGEIGYSLPGVVTNPPAEDLSTLVRFAGAFDLAYRRFEDLKEAEAQVREAQIEAALERVRSKAMAMHSSEDLALTIDHFFHELKNLNVKPIRCGVGIKDGDSRIVDVTVTSATEKGDDIKLTGKLKLGGHPILDKVYEALQHQVEYFPVLVGKEIKEYYLAMNPDIEFPNFSEDDVQYGYYFHYKEGGLFAWTTKELLEEEINIFRRFKSVLSLTYRRYLDLKDAEAKTREALIETGLERVRARTMAMHKSNELAQTAAHLFEQLNELGIKPYRCNIAIVDAENHKIKLWSTTNSGNVIPTATSIPLEEYSVFEEMYEGWKSQKDNHVIKLDGKDRVNWTEYITKYIPFDEYKFKNISEDTLLNESAIFSNFYFKQGFFVIHTIEEINEVHFRIIQRFANVFEQTYTRFLDLENAELQNKIIQAENERKTQELEEARELQLSMLPKELPQLTNYEIAVYMQTATEVGGDYYDFHVGKDGTLTAVIGDATGHGMKAGTIVTITKSLFHSLASEKDILSSFAEISRVIKGMNFRQLSMCLIIMEIKDNALSISSAAMPPALIFRSKDESVEELSFQGMPLGAMKNFPYQLKETKIHSGDTIFLFSDGLPELMNDKKEMYGYDRTKNEFHSVGEKAPEEIVNHFKNSASDWADGNAPDDDVTFVVIKVNNN